MDLDAVRKERERWLEWKNIAPLRKMLQQLPLASCSVEIGDVIRINGQYEAQKQLEEVAKAMMPWRKGPFELFGLFIDSEWKSYIKYNLLRPHFHLKGKRVADIGCNNGYYLFRMQEDHPKKLVGFDPSALFRTQFDLINRFVRSDIVYEMLGVEHAEFYEEKFDLIFCLGVLYHRSDPVKMLKQLYRALDEEGEVLLDTFFIEGQEEMALCPASSYSKIPNIYFVPTVKALENWCRRAGFNEFEVLHTTVTTSDEQRKTEWIEGQSLENFLDPTDPSKTVEGYPAPQRVYVKLKKVKK